MGTIAAGGYWFPGHLDDYITQWILGGATEIRFHIVVIRGTTGVSLTPVWGEDLDEMKAGAYLPLSTSVAATTRGIYETGWQEIPDDALVADTLWVGVRLMVASDIESEDIAIGLAEVNTR